MLTVAGAVSQGHLHGAAVEADRAGGGLAGEAGGEGAWRGRWAGAVGEPEAESSSGVGPFGKDRGGVAALVREGDAVVLVEPAGAVCAGEDEERDGPIDVLGGELAYGAEGMTAPARA